MAKKRKQMTEEEVMDKRNVAAEHYYNLMQKGAITKEDYFYLMRDLTAWVEGKLMKHFLMKETK
jgi:hypothetical protein